MGSSSLDARGAALPRAGYRRGRVVPLRVVGQRVTYRPDGFPTAPLDLAPVCEPAPPGRTGIARGEPGRAPDAAGSVDRHDGPSNALVVVDQRSARRPEPPPSLAWRLQRWWSARRRREPVGRHRPDRVPRQPWSMFAPPHHLQDRSRPHRWPRRSS